MVELNNYLGFTFKNPEKLAGNLGGFEYEIYYSEIGELVAYTNVRLFGDLPYEDHIKSAFDKLTAFKSYTLNDDNIELYMNVSDNGEEVAFSITEDLTSFSATLSSMGYKTVEKEKPVTASSGETKTVYDIVKEQQEESRKAIMHPLPDRLPLGILGALIGTAAGLGIWILLSMTNYVYTFVIGIVVAVMLPMVLFEFFSRDKTSSVQIGVCMFLTLFMIIFGDRLIWTFDLMRWYSDITFSQAFYEVPYMIEDEIVEAFSYYEDFIIAFSAMAILYFIVIKNYISGKNTLLEIFSARKR